MEITTSLLIVLGVSVGLGAVAFWIWMLVDCVTQERSEGNDKLVWLVVIVATKLVGAIIYFFARRAPRLRASAS